MKQKKRGFLTKAISLLLAIILMFPTTSVLAADASESVEIVDVTEEVVQPTPNISESTLPQEPEISEDTSEDVINDLEEEKSDEITDGNEGEIEKQPMTGEGVDAFSEEVASDIEQRMNWIYVESAYLETPGTQRIALSWGDGTESIVSMALKVQGSNGTQEEWEISKSIENLYLFEKEYTDESQKGTYKAIELTVKEGENEKTFTMDEMGAEVLFGVNEEYAGVEELKLIEGETVDGEVSASVAMINDDGILEAEESIGAALAQASAGVQASTPSTLSVENRAAMFIDDTKAGNIVIALDPGHDANDRGASGNGLREEELTLKIANYCKEELERYSGVTVYMTRTGAACPYNKPGVACMADRVNAAYKAGAKIFVSFHLNSFNGKAYGAEVIVPNNNWKPGVGAAGTALGNAVLDELVKLGLTRRKVYSKDTTESEYYPDGSKSDYFNVQIECKEKGIPGIIVEHAFIDNASDANKFLKTEAGLKSLGVADATGIAKYLGLSEGKWVKDKNGWRYEVNGQYLKKQWLTVNGKTYFLDSRGYMVTGLCYIGAARYYFNEDGSMLKKSWKEVERKKYYFGSNGRAVTGLCYVGADRYYFNKDGSALKRSWKEVEGKKYYFGSNGRAVTGLCYVGADRYYFNQDGSMYINGWKEVEGKTYYFGADGKAVVGLIEKDGGRYYLNEDGSVLKRTWKEIDGKKYYFGSSGRAVTGLCYVGADRYYFNEDGSALKKSWKEIDGEKYYFGSNGRVVMGLCYVGADRYYFNEDGSMLKRSWKEIDGKKYYFGSNGQAVVGLCYVGADRYYFNEDGSMLKRSWKEIDGKKYYFGSNGKAVTGSCYIGSEQYVFDKNGVLLEGTYLIEGKTTVTVAQMVKYYKNSGKKYPADKLKKGGAATIDEFCQIFLEEANQENIKAEVAFTQAMKETGWLQFGGDVKIEQFNFAGLGATGNNVSGERFPDVRTGVRAQIQHLKAYGSTKPLNKVCVDTRFHYVERGTAIYVEWLGIPDNPYGKGWAAAKGYGVDLVKMIKDMKKL